MPGRRGHRLERDGLLDSFYARVSGRSGPGAGRPAKLYRRTDREIAVSLPDREYRLAGRLMKYALIGGLTEALGPHRPDAELDPEPVRCCVVLAEPRTG